MSSLLSKLKSMVSASLRGQQKQKREPIRSDAPDEAAAPKAEISEGLKRRETIPEVTDATAAEMSVATPEIRTPHSVDRVEAAAIGEKQSDDLEDARIIDLLNDKQA